MSSYQLTYFNARGRAEVIRMLFAKAGVEYEDKRITKEEWASLKEKTPFGQLPILQVDGAVLAQSIAISRFLAKKFGLHGSTELEEAQIDAICLAMEDLLKPLERFYHEEKDEAKATIKEKYEKEDLPRFLKSFTKILEQNKVGKGVFVGNDITVADIYFAHYSTMPETCSIAINWADHPELKEVKDKVESEPQIAEWIQNRPKTPH